MYTYSCIGIIVIIPTPVGGKIIRFQLQRKRYNNIYCLVHSRRPDLSPAPRKNALKNKKKPNNEKTAKNTK